MKILHLAAGNRWTGAAAPAYAEVEALRAAGIDAHYAYTGGYKLQSRLREVAFAHPIIEKNQNPVSFARTLRAIEQLITAHGIDILHAHLSYDHWLARFAARKRRTPVVRTFHSGRVLRRGPMTRSLLKGTTAVAIVNDTFVDRPVLRERDPVFTPPPLDRRVFTPSGSNVRSQYGVAHEERLIAVIGKLSRGRGFEDALRAFAIVRRGRTNVRMMIIGHGEHQPALESLARELGVAGAVIWAGYHEADLAEHYRAADVLLFTAAGSDEGHRAIIEAMACGLPPITYPIAGVSRILGEQAGTLIAGDSTAESLAVRATAVLDHNYEQIRDTAIARTSEFDYVAASRRLMSMYERLLS